MDTRTKSERGMAMVMAIFFVSVAMVVLGALTFRLMTQDKHVTRYVTHKATFNGLEAGLVQAKLELEAEDEKRVDEILARLHERGMRSLSPEDRALLERVSQRYRSRQE